MRTRLRVEMELTSNLWIRLWGGRDVQPPQLEVFVSFSLYQPHSSSVHKGSLFC
jgi:hypothetical protein